MRTILVLLKDEGGCLYLWFNDSLEDFVTVALYRYLAVPIRRYIVEIKVALKAYTYSSLGV